MNIQKIEITKLKPAEYNPRKDLKPEDEEYQKIKRSIIEFGYVAPVIVNSDMTVIGGHQRLKVLKELGYNEVECVVVDLNKNKEKALNIALNKISGDWDNNKLEELLAELKETDIDLDITGFSFDEVDNILKDITGSKEDDFDIQQALDEIDEPTTKTGDIWILGRHRLMCGDSTQKEQVLRLMNNQEADMLLTDPPYNVDYEGKTADALKINNDKMKENDFRVFLKEAFRNANEVMKPGACFYIWHADSEGYNFRGACFDIGWKVRQCLIWRKNSLVMGRQDYQWQHEPCLYGWKDGASHLWASDRKQTTILDFDRPTRNAEHPTMKPVQLFDYQIKNNTKGNDIVLDLFAGSGTTIMASEQNNRIAYCMELDPKYVDVIIKRWEDFTGKKAIKLN